MKYEEFYERLKTVAQANLKKIQDEMLDDSVCREYTAAVTLFSNPNICISYNLFTDRTSYFMVKVAVFTVSIHNNGTHVALGRFDSFGNAEHFVNELALPDPSLITITKSFIEIDKYTQIPKEVYDQLTDIPDVLSTQIISHSRDNYLDHYFI